MKTQIFLLTLFSLALVGAITYSGESVSFLLPEQYEYYSIVGNSTPINLYIIQDGLNITITVDKYMRNDSFSLVFFNREKEVITNPVYIGGGGSGRTKYVDKIVDKEIEVPKFYDRNITEVINKEIVVDKIILKKTIKLILIGLILGIIIGWSIFFPEPADAYNYKRTNDFEK